MLETQIVELNAQDHLSRAQFTDNLFNRRLSLVNTYGACYEISVWDSSGSGISKYLAYKSGNNYFVMDAYGNFVNFSTLDTLSASPSGRTLETLRKIG